MDVPRARQLTTPSFVNVRTVMGLLLFSIASLAGYRVLDSARTTVPVWSATRDLPSGVPLASSDLRAVEVRLPGSLMVRYALASADLEGVELVRAIPAGELIPRAALSARPGEGGGRAITIPLSADHGVGGALGPGDRIDVFATFDAGDVRARTVPVARDVEILDLVHAASLVEESSPVGATLAVTPQQAVRLAFAQRTGEIDVARIDGDSLEPVETVRASDFP